MTAVLPTSWTERHKTAARSVRKTTVYQYPPSLKPSGWKPCAIAKATAISPATSMIAINLVLLTSSPPLVI